ncbi:unnamed protein product [Anisakis simplex]|uniref:Spc7 domain-containing protein n=1 Tax=Anisakis simplex TaxID=6269 RepID=A0A0M3IY51_ANISI|nr:unnamed protein product [Anisakis simplex]
MAESSQSFVELSSGVNQDNSQESLAPEAKQMLEKHFEEVTPSSNNKVTTPQNAFQEAAKISRNKFVNMSEANEELQRVKDENFELKKEIFILKRELPNVIDADGKDIIAEYIECRDKIFNAETRRMVLEEELRTMKMEMNDQKRKFEQDREELNCRWKNAIEERDSLSEELAKVGYFVSDESISNNINMKERRELFASTRLTNKLQVELSALQSNAIQHCVSSDEQGDSTLENLSIMSTRDKVIEDLKGTLLEMTVKESGLRDKVDSLIAEIESSKKKLNEEKELRISAERSLANLQIQYDQLTEEKKLVESKWEGEMKKWKSDIDKRDKAINSLLRKLEQTNSLLMMNSTGRNTRNGDSEMNNEDGGMSASEEIDQSSIWDAERLRAENSEINKELARNQQLPTSQSFTDMMNLKHKEISVGVSFHKESSIREDEIRTNSMMNPNVSEMASMAGLYDCSLVAVQHLDTVGTKISQLHKICYRLFEKLRGCADFLQSLLDQLGNSEKGQALIDEIHAMRLDFDQSEMEASELLKGVEEAKRGIDEFKDVLSKSIEISMINVSTLAVDVSSDQEKRNMQRMVEETQAELMHLQSKLKGNESEMDGLRSEIATLENDRTKLIQNLEEERSSKEELERKMNELQEVISAQEVEHTTRIKEFEYQVNDLENRCVDAERELQQSCEQIRLLEKHLEDSQKSLCSRNVELEKNVAKLKSKEEEMNRYEMELALLEQKTNHLVTSFTSKTTKRLRKTQENAESNKDHASEDVQATATEHFPQISLISSHLNCLVGELDRVRAELDMSRKDRNITENKYRDLVEELNAASAMSEELSNKSQIFQQQIKTLEKLLEKRTAPPVQSKRTQSDLRATAIGALEANVKKLENENTALKENFNAMCATVAESDGGSVASKNLKEFSKQTQQRTCFTTTIGSCTSLSASEITEIEKQLKAYEEFATKVYEFIRKWNKTPQKASKTSFSPADLNQLYKKLLRIHEKIDEQIDQLKDRINTKDQQIEMIASSNPPSANKKESQSVEHPPVKSPESNKTSISDEHISAFRVELSESDFNETLLSSNWIVQAVKKLIENKPLKEREHILKEMLEKGRNVRGLLTTLCNRIERYEQAKLEQKENMDPNVDTLDTFKNENIRLQLALDDAQETLKAAYEKLSAKPDSTEMSERIVHELQKILRTMKSTKRDARLLDRRSKRNSSESDVRK